MQAKTKRRAAVTAAAGAVAVGLTFAVAQPSFGSQNAGTITPQSSGSSIVLTGAHAGTTTPIQHVVVLFDENVSFDHYFGTYPNAANTDGTTFHAKANTPTVDGLSTSLLENNPNGVNPSRLNSSQALTCDQDHNDTAEQKAYDMGLADQFPANTGVATCSSPDQGMSGLVMDYYDGNTVTALWNYAQNYAMSDNSYDTTYGPSTPGAINLISGQTYGGTVVDANGNPVTATSTVASPNSSDLGTDIGDMDPYYDDCSKAGNTLKMTGTNIGDLLNAKNVTWGWFQGGFGATTAATSSTKAVCGATHTNIGGATIADYSAHHDPFEYYASTANPHHVAPASEAEVGRNGQANHQYDLSYFYQSIKDGNLPSVSYVKQAEYQDGHAGYSDPLDEQAGIVNTINAIESSKYWSSTAIVIQYDDSDGWYDHAAPPNVNSSADPAVDALDGTGKCGSTARTPLAGEQDRCGYGPRLPELVISPYAKSNFVDHSVTDQTSSLAFIEQNWSTGTISGSLAQYAGSLDSMFDFGKKSARRVLLSPTTGAVLRD
ncbi:alkaline phosphatase family protein [Actinospica sp. MGRD01-02]|uniref:Alkaline phosphatase family protein n=1 Tax=Actinospica acidithermotolerans TaxID=2828514 RepID=A0A941E8Y3_9ACTN|nr:alkaline phosphatase family protein [Actinospica acidithermotolerans]MBR7826098.1 alkaline phosphatase family protein [Actinospica acidithermotolerans]